MTDLLHRKNTSVTNSESSKKQSPTVSEKGMQLRSKIINNQENLADEKLKNRGITNMSAAEQADRERQDMLKQQKKSILMVKQNNLIKGYTEVLVGEKQKAYEDEEDTQKDLIKSQKAVKDQVRENMAKIKPMDDPKTMIYRKTTSIDQEIDECEKSLKNPFFFRLGDIWRADVARKRGNSSTFSPMSKNKSFRNKNQMELTQQFLKLHPAYQQKSPRSNNNSLMKQHQRSSTVFGLIPQPGQENLVTSTLEEIESRNKIAETNLQLIQNSHLNVTEGKANTIKQLKNDISKNKHGFNLKEHETLLSRESRDDIQPIDQSEEQPSKDFASPLNKRLDEMKKNLHNLMFNVSLDQELMSIQEDGHNFLNAKERDQEFRGMHDSIMRDLQEAQGHQFRPEFITNQNYDMLNLKPSAHSQGYDQQSYAQNLTFLASRSDSKQGQVQFIESAQKELSTIQSRERTHQLANKTTEELTKLQNVVSPQIISPVVVPERVENQNVDQKPQSENKDDKIETQQDESVNNESNQKQVSDVSAKVQVQDQTTNQAHQVDDAGQRVQTEADKPPLVATEALNDAKGASNLTIDKIIKSDGEEDEAGDQDNTDTQGLREDDTGEEKQEATASPEGESLFTGPLTEAHLHNYYSIEQAHQMINDAQPPEPAGITEISGSETQSFQDKAFEEDFKKLVDRLNSNLQMHDRSDLKVTQIAEDIQLLNEQKRLMEMARSGSKTRVEDAQSGPFKSSHISHIQALIGHRDQYAARLREFDQAKSTQSHHFIRQKLAQPQRQVQNSVNAFGPIKASGDAVQITGDQSTNFMSNALQSSGRKDNSQENIKNKQAQSGYPNFGPITVGANASHGQLGAPQSMLNNKSQQYALNRINSPSTDLNEDFLSHGQLLSTDPASKLPFQMTLNEQNAHLMRDDVQYQQQRPMATSHERILDQVRANQQSHQRFKDYLRNLKRGGKESDPAKLRIQGVPTSSILNQPQQAEYYVEQIAPGVIQYSSLDGSDYYLQTADGNLIATGQQYAFGYAGAQQELQIFGDEQIQPGSEYQNIPFQSEAGMLNKQQLNQNSQGNIQTEQYQHQYGPSQMFQVEGAGYQSGQTMPVAGDVNDQSQLNADLSADVTEPNRPNQTSADQLDTGSGSDGVPVGQLGSGALQGQAYPSQKMPVNFEFTSQRTLQAGSKETIANESEQHHRLSQEKLQAQLLRNQKRATERGDVLRNQNKDADVSRGYLQEGAQGRKRHSEDAEEHQGRKTIEFQQNNDSGININSQREASESKLSKAQQLRPMIQGGVSPERAQRAMIASGALLVPEDPAEVKVDAEGRTPLTKDQAQNITPRSVSQKQFLAVVSKNVAVEVGPGASEPKIISNQGPKGRWNNKQNFQSLKPKVANQLMILPDMQILSPLHIHKMSPQPSRETVIKNIQGNKQTLLAQLERQNYSTAYPQGLLRPTPLTAVQTAQQIVAQKAPHHGQLATINTSQASSKVHVFQREPSKARLAANAAAHLKEGTENRDNTREDSKENTATHKHIAQSALKQQDNGDLVQLDKIMKSDVLITKEGSQERNKDSLGTKSLKNPVTLGEHVTKSNSQETLKTQRIQNKLNKVDSHGGQSGSRQGIFNYIKVQASGQDGALGMKLQQKKLNKVEPQLTGSLEGLGEPSRRADIEQRKRAEGEAQEKIAGGHKEFRAARSGALRNSKLHRHKYHATLEQALLAQNAQVGLTTFRSQLAGSLSPRSGQVRANGSPDRTHTTKFMSKQHSRDSFKKTLKEGSVSKMDHSASEMANLKGSVYGVTLHDQSSMFQIKQVGRRAERPDAKKHNINVASNPPAGVLHGVPIKKNLAVNSQESDNNTDRGVDDVKGFHTALEVDSDQKRGSTNVLNFVSSQTDIERGQRRYRSNDPRAVYQNAKLMQQDIELDEKRRRVFAINQQKKALKARNKSLTGAQGGKKDGNFQAVKMNSLLTLEELLTIHTKQVNDQVLPFVIGPKTSTHKDGGRQARDWPQATGQSASVLATQTADAGKAPGASGATSGFHLQTWALEGANSRVDTVNKRSHGSSFDNSGIGQSSDKQRNFEAQADGSSNEQSRKVDQTQAKGVKLKMQLEKDGVARKHQQTGAEQARITQATPFGAINIEPSDPLRETNPDIAGGTKTFVGKKKTSAASPARANEKGLNLTLQPFKAILISNPWEQGAGGPSSNPAVAKQRNDKGQALTQSKLQMHQLAKAALPHGANKSPSGVFRNSPRQTQQSNEDKGRQSKQSVVTQRKTNHQIRGSISSGRLQGFGGISNANNTGFNMLMVSPNLHGESAQNIHDIHMSSQQDFTIEEKLNEESYISKDNFRPYADDKTMEYKGEGQFSSSARNTTEAFKAAAQTATRLGDTPNYEMPAPAQPMIRIQNNQMEVPNLITEASVKSRPANSKPHAQ